MRSVSVKRQRTCRWQTLAAVAVLLGGLTIGQAAVPPQQPGKQAAGAKRGGLTATSRPGSEVIEELHINDLDLARALRMLTGQTHDNVVLSGKVDANQKVEANLYNVTFEQALESILTPLGLGYKRQGNFIYIHSRKELEEMAKQQRAVGSAVFKLHYVTATDAATLIKPLLSPAGQVAISAPAAVGITNGISSTGGNSYSTDDALVITDYPENIQAVSHVLKDLDVRPRQVLVEGTILRATLTEDNALGVDFNLLGGVDFNAQFVPANASGSSSSGSGSSGDSGTGGSTTPSIIPVPGNAGSLAAGMTQHLVNEGVVNVKTDFLDPTLFPTGGFSFGVIKNNIAAFIRALEEVTDTTVVANPKVLALNKQKGEVIVGRRDGYLTTIVTEVDKTQKVEFLETGVQLIFRPFIGDDGYVRMELHPKDSNGAITVANLPFEETTEVTTNVLVKDGHTIIIGGLFREQTSANRSQVPWLGNIPYAGVLFRRQADKTIREEVIILLTVHIVENEQAYAAAGEKTLDDVERIRVGAREGLMPHGRERLAQAHYKWAMEHLEAGDPHKALWDLDMATQLNRRFLDAIVKKEELTGQRAWDANSSVIRNYIYTHVLDAEDDWVDTQGAPAERLMPAPDADSREWGVPVRQSPRRRPATQPSDSR